MSWSSLNQQLSAGGLQRATLSSDRPQRLSSAPCGLTAVVLFVVLAFAASVSAQSPAVQYTYDSLDRLVSVRYANRLVQYTYDAAGNRLSMTVTVIKVIPVVTWANPATITYGTVLSDTQLNASASVPGTFVYAPPAGTVLSAGAGQTLSVNFTPTDLVSFEVVTRTVSIDVGQATPVVTWLNPAAITHGTALSGAQLNATASVPGAFVYSPAAGTVLPVANGQVLSATFTPTDSVNFTTATATASIDVGKATPVITWSNPGAITYGTPLTETQLNATSPVAGTFDYTPSPGTILTAGTHALATIFTPTDGTNYTTATASVSITVSRALPIVTWANPSPIVLGTPLSGTQLNATADVPGTFSYDPPLGTLLDVGVGQVLSVAFTPTDLTNYTTATATVTIDVSPPPPNTGRITGTVTDLLSGDPLAGIPVRFYDQHGTYQGSASSDSEGVYRSAPLVAGPYYLRTYNSLTTPLPARGYVSLVYPNILVRG